MSSAIDATFDLARDVAEVLREEGVEPLIIGALALAAHHFPRQTEDVDLAIAVPPSRLLVLADALRRRGLEVHLSMPDTKDPLGGLIRVEREGALPIEIINFDNAPSGGFPAIVRDAAARATPMGSDLPLRVVDVIDLVILKVYAGGPKAELDIQELLVRNPVDLGELRRRCRTYRLEGALDQVLSKLSPPLDGGG